MFLTGHYLHCHSATPTVPAAPPPHLQAAQLGYSTRARECMMGRVRQCDNINDYCNYCMTVDQLIV